MWILCLPTCSVDEGIQLLDSCWEVTTLLVGLALIARQLNVQSCIQSRGIIWWWVLDWVAELVLQLNLEIAHAFVLREVPLESLLLPVEAAEHIVRWFGVGMLLAGWELCVRGRGVVPPYGADGSCLIIGVGEVDCCQC